MPDNQPSPSKELYEQKGCTLTLSQVRAIHQYREPEVILELSTLREQLTATQQALNSTVERAMEEAYERDNYSNIQEAEIARLTQALHDSRESVIEEICEEYYGEIIKGYKLVQKSGEFGRYVHEKDIEFYEKLQRELRKQEWVNKAALASIKE